MYLTRYLFTLICGGLIAHSLHAAPTDVLGIGGAGIDYYFTINDKELDSIEGEKGGSLHVTQDAFCSLIDNNAKHMCAMTTGGSCANVMKGLANLKVKAEMFGKVGEDEEADFLRKKMDKIGLDHCLIPCECPTQRVCCFITPDGQRTMRCLIGAGGELNETDIEADLFRNKRLVHIEGYALFNNDLVEESLLQAKRANALVSFDMGCTFLAKEFRDKVLNQLLKNIDIFFLNSDEAVELTALKTAKEACHFLQQHCSIVVVCDGENGCWIGSSQFADSPYYCKTTPIDSPADTTGAGDFFASGFLYAYLKGYPLDVCGRCGNAVGHSIVQVTGTDLSHMEWKGLKRKLDNMAPMIMAKAS